MTTPSTDPAPPVPAQRRRQGVLSLRDRYVDAMVYHVNQAEDWQAKVKQIEEAAEQQAKGRNRPVGGTVLANTYVVNGLLKDNHDYNRACAIRNNHQTQANMYAAAATALSQAWAVAP